MKTLKYVNHTFIGILILLALSTIFIEQWLGFLAIGLFFLGVFQVFFGFILFIAYPRNISYQIYMVGILGFAILCFLKVESLWFIPPIPLALYFTYMVHNPIKKIVV